MRWFREQVRDVARQLPARAAAGAAGAGAKAMRADLLDFTGTPGWGDRRRCSRCAGGPTTGC
jgi:hypothetical protein